MEQHTLEAPLIEIADEPAYNILNSFVLLNEIEQKPALDAWVTRTAAALTEAQRQCNRLVFGPLQGALLLEAAWPDFPTYLAALEVQPVNSLRERTLTWLQNHDSEATLLDKAHPLVERPDDMRDQIVAHLRELWEQHGAAEWKRTSGTLQNQTRAMLHNYISAPNVRSIEQNLRALIGPELWADPAVVTAATNRVVYVNSPHTGRYVTWLHSGTTLRIFFNAVRSMPAIMRTTPVGRTELAGRLNALADQTRLGMLALFEHQDTLSAQDIMAQLALTQSTTSRHIRPLLAFLHESRGPGANKRYSFSPALLELTFQAVRDLVGQGAIEDYDDVRLAYPEPLRRYMNREGKLTMLPLRQQDRQTALLFVLEQIEEGRNYSEKEINMLIQSQIAFADFVTIRRELYNSRLLNREPDGSRYWRAERV